MSLSINKQTLIGHVGQEPVEKILPNNLIVVTFSVATNRSWINKDSGETQEATDWHNIVLFNKQAQRAMDFLKKGSKVYIEGSARTKKWEKDGQTHYMTQVYAETWIALDKSTQEEGAKILEHPPQQVPAEALDNFDADIPF